MKPKVKKVKKESDELIPIISPFYGPFEQVEEKVEKKKEEPSVEQNLRNIAILLKKNKIN